MIYDKNDEPREILKRRDPGDLSRRRSSVIGYVGEINFE
jgi:hypothetical protein